MTTSGGSHVVVTTIQAPTSAMREWHQRLGGDSTLVVVGDAAGPPDFPLPGVVFLDLSAQQSSPFALGGALPSGHYARKNIGYLWSIADGADRLYETDDDNAPQASWAHRDPMVAGRLVRGEGWCNAYAHFTDEPVWPRGLPLDAVVESGPLPADSIGEDGRRCVIQQGLADGSPDVDAIWRLTQDRPVTFDRRAPLLLDEGVWCPFNSQSTWWWPEAFPLLYLPSHCTFRMTDIWRSFVAQRCLWAIGERVAFHSAEVVQDRNEHDLMRDFTDELPGYLHNRAIATMLGALDLDPDPNAITDNLERCYDALIAAGHVGGEESHLLRIWIADLDELR